VKCDRQLFKKLKALKADELREKTKRYLTKSEVNRVMARRDKIVATFQTLITRKRRERSSSTSPSEAHCAASIPPVE
jgi:hypothetical protein